MATNRYGRVSADVIEDPDLSLGAKAVYSSLAIYAGKDRTCFPSITHIAELNGVSRRTIQRHIKTLQKKGYVRKSGRTFTIK